MHTKGDELIVGFLRPSFAEYLTKSLNAGHVHLVSSWHELGIALRTRRVSLVLADPFAGADPGTEYIADLLRAFPAIPIRAYVSLTAPEFRAVAYLSRLGLDDVILHGSDDCSPTFASTLSHYRAIPFVAEVVAWMRPQLERLPARLERTIRDVFDRPHRYSTAIDMCNEAGMSMGILYRRCADAGVSPPKKILIAGKVLRGYGYLLDPGASIQEVAMKLGYPDARGFGEHVGLVFGQSPSAIRMRADEEIVLRVKRWLQRDREMRSANTRGSRQ